MQKRISPASRLSGSIALPGDKSISHRYAMIAAIAEGHSRIRNYSTGADCHSTLGCLRALGIDISGEGTEFTVHGRGLDGLRAPAADLDAGNSGSTIRMLSGILAAQPFPTRIVGDESLSRRPMQRIMKPLAAMGAHIQAREDKFPPLEIHGAQAAADPIRPAGAERASEDLCAVRRALRRGRDLGHRAGAFARPHGNCPARIRRGPQADRGRITLAGRPTLTGRELVVPSDLSSAAFFLAAALLVPGSRLSIRGVGLNPTRSALLDFLIGMGARNPRPRPRKPQRRTGGRNRGGTLGAARRHDRRSPDRGADRRDPGAGGAGRRDRGRAHGSRRLRAAHQGDGPHPDGGGEPPAHGCGRGRICPTAWWSPAGRSSARPSSIRSAIIALPWHSRSRRCGPTAIR